MRRQKKNNQTLCLVASQRSLSSCDRLSYFILSYSSLKATPFKPFKPTFCLIATYIYTNMTQKVILLFSDLSDR